ncbi:MAG TPA: hypothetical protein VIK04_03435 [Solirubrobacteraceae bacterium]
MRRYPLGGVVIELTRTGVPGAAVVVVLAAAVVLAVVLDAAVVVVLGAVVVVVLGAVVVVVLVAVVVVVLVAVVVVAARAGPGIARPAVATVVNARTRSARSARIGLRPGSSRASARGS